MLKFHTAVELKLTNALSVSLIVDIWTNRVNADFMGVGANLICSTFQTELIVIGMERMPGIHNAENIGLTIEKIINSYNFDKNKIHSKCVKYYLIYISI